MIHDLTLDAIRNVTTYLMTHLIPDMVVDLLIEPTLDLSKGLTPDMMIHMKPDSSYKTIFHLFSHDLIPHLVPDPLRDGIIDLMVDATPDLILCIPNERSLDLTPSTLPDVLYDLFFMTFHGHP